MSQIFADEQAVMRRAIELAAGALGRVEPNPPVGAVIVDDDLRLLGEGYHQEFGGPHAEIHALEQAGERASGATLFVTLEPCSHQGKTGPCHDAVRSAGIKRVVIGVVDPSPHSSGRGIAALRDAGLEVEAGFLEDEARRLAAPFFKLVETGLPYVHAKWAMTLDGKIASRTGSSKWITSAKSREKAHELRGRMDAIVVGAGTAKQDDPLLTARPPGPRTPVRIVLSRSADISLDSQLVRTAAESPVLVAVGDSASEESVRKLSDGDVEVLRLAESDSSGGPEEPRLDLRALLEELGQRRMTNILVEGGGQLLGALFDEQLIDHAHVFIAPKLIGGSTAVSPLSGVGLAEMTESGVLDDPRIDVLEDNVYVHGSVRYEREQSA